MSRADEARGPPIYTKFHCAFVQAIDAQARCTTRCPCVCSLIGLAVALLLAMVAVAGGGMAPDIPSDGRNVYAVLDWEGTKKHDAMLHAMRSVQVDGLADQQSAKSREFAIINYVSKNKDNVLTLPKLRMIQELDRKLTTFPEFSDMCYKVAGKCDIMSITKYLTDDGTVGGPLPTSQAELEVRLQRLVPSAGNASKLQTEAAYFFEKGFGDTRLKSVMTRTMVVLGLPLKGYKNKSDRKFEQEDRQAEWLKELSDEVLDKEKDKLIKDGIEMYYVGSTVLINKQIQNRIMGDLLFAFGSFCFVWLYMWFHTGSLYLASFGMFLVLLAFPTARTISKYFFGVVWYDFLNQLLLFLLLGIGADNLFVMVDAFKQSEFLSNGMQCGTDGDMLALQRRLSYVSKRAGHAMMTTSFTTAGAFLSNIFSGIAPTAGFGIFAGTMIISNFIFCYTVFPAAVAVHHTYLKKKCSWIKFPTEYCCRQSASAQEDGQEWSLKSYSREEQFFYTTVAKFVIKFRIPLAALCLLTTIGGIILATRLDPASTTPQFLPEDDPMQATFNRLQCDSRADFCYKGNASQESLNVAMMVWGIQNKPDRQGFTRFQDFTADCQNTVCGVHKWDDMFDPSEAAVQQLILQTCQDGLASPNAQFIDTCIMKDFQAWIANDTSRGSFPVPKASFNTMMTRFLNHQETNAGGTTLRPYRVKFLDSRIIGLENGKVKYLMVGWKTQYILGRLYPSSTLQKNYDQFMALEKRVALKFKALPGGGNPYITEKEGHEFFLTFKMSQEFEDSVVRGIIISMIISFVMLFFATGNVIITTIALFTIFAITCCTIGSMYIYGWEVGIIEAICAVLVVGFSVDYTVHLGISYVERRPEDDGKYKLGSTRSDRVTHAFFELGTSVAAGAMTTLGASLFLFACKVQFFKIFGIFICTVIFWSLVYSHALFMPLCALIGPVGSTGDLSCKCCLGTSDEGSATKEGKLDKVSESVSDPEKGAAAS